MANLIKIEPQPRAFGEGWWELGDNVHLDDGMSSHLFHDVWGNDLDNTNLDPEVYTVEPVISDGVWYWKPLLIKGERALVRGDE